jgi:predicted nucleic acid-binding Zn ribbon protein
MARKSNAQPLAEVIDELMRVYGLNKKMDEVLVAEGWEKLMGPAIFRQTKSIKLVNNHLVLRLESAVLREEFSYSKTKIITILNEYVGRPVVKSVDIR